MQVVPTFHFHGQCQEALALYKRAFPVEMYVFLQYKDADPKDLPFVEERFREYVYHSEISLCGARVRMCDELEPGSGAPQTDLFLAVSLDTPEQVRQAWDILLPGANVLVPIHSATFSPCVGSLVDRFGMRWGLMVEV